MAAPNLLRKRSAATSVVDFHQIVAALAPLLHAPNSPARAHSEFLLTDDCTQSTETNAMRRNGTVLSTPTKREEIWQ